LLRDHGGAVVDIIDLQWWPVFNVADAAITCGAALLVVAGASGERPAPGGPPPAER
ncbi:MAG: signal peptidase II, partial [Acidimicrobiia bacterium]